MSKAKRVKQKDKNDGQSPIETQTLDGGGLRTFYPKVSDEVVTEAFKKAVGEPKEGTNSIVPKFLHVMAFCMQNLEAFTINEVQNYSKAFDLDPREVKRLYAIWLQKSIDLRRVEITHGVYDDIIVQPV